MEEEEDAANMGKYSTPVTYQSSRKQGNIPAQASKKEYPPLDWSMVDVVAMIEKHTSTRLSGKGHHTQLVGPCPFPDCSSKENGFIVWPNGSKRSTEKSIVHYFCRNCPVDRRSGDLIKLLRLLYPDWTFQRVKLEIGMIGEEGNETQEPPAKIHNTEQAKRDVWFREQLEMLQGYYNQLQAALVKYERPQLYLLSRGINLQDAQRYGLGYFPTVEETRRKIDDPHIAKWAGRLIFPLSGPRSSELTFEGRTLLLWQEGMSPEQHKQAIGTYNASHEDQIERVLKTSPCGNFGYAEAIKQSHIVVSEGPCDALSLLIAGVPGVVAMGISLPAKAIPLNVERVTLALDSDLPGRAAAKHLASSLADRGIEVTTILPSSGKDWNDTHIQDGLSAIVKAFNPEPIEQPDESSDQEEPLYVCSVLGCSVNAVEDDSFYFDANGVPYCGKHGPQAAAQEDVSQSEQDESSDHLERMVSYIGSVFGPCTVEYVEPGLTLQAYLEQKYPDAKVYEPDEYIPVTLPALPRSLCPHMSYEEEDARDASKKSYYKRLKAIPCSGTPGPSGWCLTHEHVSLMLALAAKLGYPEFKVSESLIILAGVAHWEEYATHAMAQVPLFNRNGSALSNNRLNQILPRLKAMVDQSKQEARQLEPVYA